MLWRVGLGGQYTDGSFADVKSISQQAMCRYWARAAGDQPFPSLDQFRPEARLHDPKQLIIWSVERRGAGHTFARFTKVPALERSSIRAGSENRWKRFFHQP